MPTPTVVRRRRAIKAGISLLVLSLLAAIIARFYMMYTAPPSPEKVSGLTDQETEILGLVNQQRVRGGLRPLKFSARLAVIARGHSYDMAMRHYLAHSSPDGSLPRTESAASASDTTPSARIFTWMTMLIRPTCRDAR